MRVLDDATPLLRLLPDAEQSHARALASEDVFGVDRPEPRELRQLHRRAIDVGPAVDHDHGLAGGREDGADGGAAKPRVQRQELLGGGHLGARVSRRDERVRSPVRLEPEADHHRALDLAPQRHRGAIRHVDHVRRIDQLETCAKRPEPRVFPAKQRLELLRDDARASDELNRMCGVELSEGEQRAGDGRTGSVVAPHGVQRDARQG